jgi:hypothetical protein
VLTAPHLAEFPYARSALRNTVTPSIVRAALPAGAGNRESPGGVVAHSFVPSTFTYTKLLTRLRLLSRPAEALGFQANPAAYTSAEQQPNRPGEGTGLANSKCEPCPVAGGLHDMAAYRGNADTLRGPCERPTGVKF